MKNLTTEILDQFANNDDWAGFGYIGERENQLFTGRDVTAADEMLLESANRQGLTADELFDWANSKAGRWYGDCWFGANGQHAEKYLPTK